MDDEGDSGRAPQFGLALQVIRCVVVAALLTSAVWLLATCAFDWAGFR